TAPTSLLFPYTTLFRSARYVIRTSFVPDLRLRVYILRELRNSERMRRLCDMLLPSDTPILEAGKNQLWSEHRIPERSMDEHRGRSEEHTSELQSRGHLV